MKPELPHSRPSLGPEELHGVWRVLQSGHLAQGPEVAAFERELGERLGATAVAVSTGTAALHLGLLALEARRVALPSYSCVSLLNAVVMAGAEPILQDCLRPDRPEANYDAPADVYLVPHMFGRLSPLPEGTVLEDATHAVGVAGVGRGALTACSFYATKMLAAGEGGALLGRRRKLLAEARDLRSYDERPDWRLRYNYKMTDLSAAILRAQLARLDRFLERRAQIAAYYRRELSPLLECLEDTTYRFVVLHPRALPHSRRPVYRPLHRYLGKRGFPHTEKFWRNARSLPFYPDLTDSQVERVALEVASALG